MTKQASSPSANPAIPPAAVPQLRFRTARAVTALVIREMTTTYGRSPGGYLWAVAQPVALIVVLISLSPLMYASSFDDRKIPFFSIKNRCIRNA